MTAIERLTQLHAAYRAQFGDTPHPLLTLMASALDRRSERLAAAVVEDVEADQATREAEAMAAIAKTLDADRRAASLWLVADVEAVIPKEMQTPEQALSRDSAIRLKWEFRRESEVMIGGGRLAAKILFPATSAATRLVEAAGRVLGQRWRDIVIPHSDARAALLAAATTTTKERK